MAKETGVIAQVITQEKGSITRDLQHVDPNPVDYFDPTLTIRKVFLAVGDKVSYDIDSNNVVSNVALLIVEPADEGTVKTGAGVGFSISAGQTFTIKGGVITGDITMSGGKLIIKTDSVIKGTIDAQHDAELQLYNSTVEKTLRFANSNKQVIIHNGSVGGDTDIRNSTKVIHNGSVGGDTDIRNNMEVSIDGLVLTGAGKNLDIRNNKTSTVVKNVTVNGGDVSISHNAGCSYSNIVALTGTVDISDCTMV